MNDDARVKARVARKDTEFSEKTRLHAYRVQDRRMRKQDTRRSTPHPKLVWGSHAEMRRDRLHAVELRSCTARPGRGRVAT